MSPLALSLRLLQTQPDSRLLALARDGHEPAFEALVRRYRRPLLAYSRRISDGASSEDVIQQAMLQAWRALGAGVQVNEARPWLYRIVHNATISAVRSAGERPATLVDMASDYGVEQVVEERLAAREALASVAALPELQREVMFATAVEGRSQKEVAGELGLSGGSVRGLLYRARATLRSAAAGLIPAPVVDWAIRTADAVRTGPAQAIVGGGSVGAAGVLIKGGAAATLAGAIAGAAAIVTTHAAPHHQPAPPVRVEAHRPAGSGREVRHSAILLASTDALADAAVGQVQVTASRSGSTTRTGDAQSSSRDQGRSRSEPGDRSTAETRRVLSSAGHDGAGEGGGDGANHATSASALQDPATGTHTRETRGGENTSPGLGGTGSVTGSGGDGSTSGSGGDHSSPSGPGPGQPSGSGAGQPGVLGSGAVPQPPPPGSPGGE